MKKQSAMEKEKCKREETLGEKVSFQVLFECLDIVRVTNVGRQAIP